ncbi:MAG: hypothetical protein O3B76_05870 [Proteobacteria bacterium]|nr:hypothetical protein [Pseudomonadota bacterium]MDA1023435.1 hypothetical protein [Pseudomonadota bacterium]
MHDYVSPIAMTKNLPIADPLPGGSSSPPFVSAALPELAPVGGTQAPPGKPAVKAGREIIATLGHREKPVPKRPKAKKKTAKKAPVLRPVPEASSPRPSSPYRAARLALKTPKPLDRQAAKKKNILKPVPESGKPRVNTDPAPVSWNRPSFLIKVVQGAPGDGNAALTKAMKVALRKRDITVTEDPRQAGYVIKGQVEVSAPVGGRQQAKIVWAVNTMGGDEVGKAVQENAVKAGSLNGTWGRVADIVSNAAVSGIRELFGVDDKTSGLRIKARLEDGDVAGFAELMNEHWEHKKARSENISNDHVNDLYELALKNGARAGKLVGAGSGGFLLFYADDKDRLRAVMAKEGLQEMEFSFDFDGSIVLLGQ